jgi:hypothetical protein
MIFVLKKANQLRMVRALLGASVVTGLLIVTEARANVNECMSAHTSGQREAKAGRLRVATQLFTSCGSDELCPEQVRSDCTQLLESVRQNIPTVIFAVRDENGNDVSNVQVFSAEELITKELDGRAVDMDPGKHALRFHLPWGEVLTRDVLIRESEKNRMIEVKIEKQAAAPPEGEGSNADPGALGPAPGSAGASENKPPIAAWVAAGGALAGFGTFAGFALLGQGEKQKLEECKPNCTESDGEHYDSMKTAYLVADIGLGVGIVSATVAAVLFVSATNKEAPREAKARRRRLPTLDVATTESGGSLLLRGQF